MGLSNGVLWNPARPQSRSDVAKNMLLNHSGDLDQSREKLKTFQCKKNICMLGYRTGMVSFSKKPSAILLPSSFCHASAA